MDTELTHLSIVAHEQAMERGTATPAERREFSHLPFWRVRGIPVIDSDRMRPDQVEDAKKTLRRITDGTRNSDAATTVETWMATRFTGARVTDVMTACEISKPTALRHLRRLTESKLIEIRETKTRDGGSNRKVYHWVGPRTDNMSKPTKAETRRLHEEGLTLVADLKGISFDTGIRYHGTSVQGLSCGCHACGIAAEQALMDGEVSHARREGRLDDAREMQMALQTRYQRNGVDAEPPEQEDWDGMVGGVRLISDEARVVA